MNNIFLSLSAILFSVVTVLAAPFGSTFTYQGSLSEQGAPANGVRDFQFTLHDDAKSENSIGTPFTQLGLPVSNGLFVVELDFGPAAFDGNARWLEIHVRQPREIRFTTLTPRQALTPVPYAIIAGNLDAVSASNFWQLGGNVGTAAGTHFLGTTDDQPLELKVNGQRVLRLEPHPTWPNVIAGHPGNSVAAGIFGGTIGGGGKARVLGDFGTVGGGIGNSAGSFGTVGGGELNSTSNGGTVPGGRDNEAQGSTSFAAGNHAKALHDGSFVWADTSGLDFPSTAGNQFSIRAASGVRLDTNTSMYFGEARRQMLNLYRTNYAIGMQSSFLYFRTDMAFAWYRRGSHADNGPGGGTEMMRLEPLAFQVNGNMMRLDNVGLNVNNGMMSLNASALTVNGTFVSGSDRNAKQDFAPIKPRSVLEKVNGLPLSSWGYKADPNTRHIGPMAQDFYAAFGLGTDDKHIATVDADGVALAAIQGLNEKLEEKVRTKDGQIAELKYANDALEQRIQRLEKLLPALATPSKAALETKLGTAIRP